MDPNLKDTVPSIVFQLFIIAISFACFLPIFAYSYIKELVDNLSSEEQKNDNEIKERVASFTFTLDLILTQNIIFVFISSVAGVLLFLHSYGVIAFILKHFLLTFINTNVIIGWFLVGWFFVYLLIIVFSFFTINKKIKEPVQKRYWKSGKITLIFWLLVVLFIFIISEFISYRFIIANGDVSYRLIILFISFLSIALITGALIWIFPLIKYSPLISNLILILSKSSFSNGLEKLENESDNPDKPVI
jgi:hypothetical protein